jgi:flavin-dependent dehydrogenase
MQGGKTVDQRFDVPIIGAGVVGSAAARELARYQLKIGVLEKNRMWHQCPRLPRRCYSRSKR